MGRRGALSDRRGPPPRDGREGITWACNYVGVRMVVLMLPPPAPGTPSDRSRPSSNGEHSLERERDQEEGPGIGLVARFHHRERNGCQLEGVLHFFCTRIAACKSRVAIDGLSFLGGVGCRDDMLHASERDRRV